MKQREAHSRDIKIIKLGEEKFKLVNLTEPLKENVEVYPGDPTLKKRILASFQTENCQHNVYAIGDHIFHPHGDAPKHQNRQLQHVGFEHWGLDFAFNNACMVDLSSVKESLKIDGIRFLDRVSETHIAPYLNQIKTKTALVIRTGYDKWIEANKKHRPDVIPYIDKSAADLLSKIKKIKVVGIDSLTVDPVGKNYAHKKLKDKLIVESLVKLYNIPKKHRANFHLQTSPIAIEGATGGPVLAYAYLSLE